MFIRLIYNLKDSCLVSWVGFPKVKMFSTLELGSSSIDV